MTAELRVGQVAAAAGVNLETLRYYERPGLLPRPARSPGGHRLYPPDTITQLRVIRAAQRLGFTLAEVADLLTLGTDQHRGRRRPASLQAGAAAKLAEVEQRIADLGVIRDTLRQALDAGCDNPLECADNPCGPIPFAALASGEDAQPPP